MRGSVRVVVAGVTLLASPWQAKLGAQQAASPAQPAAADCACSVAPPGGGEETEDGRSGRKNWAILGAAGLGLVFGLPFGGGTAQGLPFAGGLPADAPAGDLAAMPAGAVPPASLFGAAPDATPAPSGPALARGPSTPLPGAPALTRRDASPRGLIPPSTATHLPLIAALGVAMAGGGAWLLRRRDRQVRRRRRKVTF